MDVLLGCVSVGASAVSFLRKRVLTKMQHPNEIPNEARLEIRIENYLCNINKQHVRNYEMISYVFFPSTWLIIVNDPFFFVEALVDVQHSCTFLLYTFYIILIIIIV